MTVDAHAFDVSPKCRINFGYEYPMEMLLFLTLPTKAEEKVIKRNISEFLASVLREVRGQSAVQRG